MDFMVGVAFLLGAIVSGLLCCAVLSGFCIYYWIKEKNEMKAKEICGVVEEE